MSSVMRPLKEKIHLIPGVVHIDNTSRVQTVYKEINENFYQLIENFYQKLIYQCF